MRLHPVRLGIVHGGATETFLLRLRLPLLVLPDTDPAQVGRDQLSEAGVLGEAVDSPRTGAVVQLGLESGLDQVPAVDLAILTAAEYVLVRVVQSTVQSVLSVYVSCVLRQQLS